MSGPKQKDSVSVNACIGSDLFRELEELCAVTGQSKTVAVERAIRAYCLGALPPVQDADAEGGGG